MYIQITFLIISLLDICLAAAVHKGAQPKALSAAAAERIRSLQYNPLKGRSRSKFAKRAEASCTTTTCSTQSCGLNNGGSDGCTPYSVSAAGVQLPAGRTFPPNAHVNFQYISCAAYKRCGSYRCPPSGGYNGVRSGGLHFDPNNNQPGGYYIGKSFFDFGSANKYSNSPASVFPGGFCILWVQVANYNQHFGEGWQTPVCNC